MKISALVLKFKVLQKTGFHNKMIIGLDYVNYVGGDKVLFISSSDAYTCVKFHENAYNSFKVIQ